VSIPFTDWGLVGWVSAMTITAPSDLLEVTPLNDHEWRVSDVRRAIGDGGREIAHVERVHDYVMVTWIAPCKGWAAFPDLEGALRALRLTCAARPMVAA
jgi:hypothetical protein